MLAGRTRVSEAPARSSARTASSISEEWDSPAPGLEMTNRRRRMADQGGDQGADQGRNERRAASGV